MTYTQEYFNETGNVTLDYYNQLNFPILQTDFDLWIDALENPMKTHFKEKGLNECTGVLSLQRFVLEKYGFSMDEFMKENLSQGAYSLWCKFER